MPIKESAKKYMRVSDRKAQHNKKVVGIFRNAIKKTREFIATKDVASAQEWLKRAIKGLDKASQKKIIKKNTAARRKSRLNSAVKNLALKNDK